MSKSLFSASPSRVFIVTRHDELKPFKLEYLRARKLDALHLSVNPLIFSSLYVFLLSLTRNADRSCILHRSLVLRLTCKTYNPRQ